MAMGNRLAEIDADRERVQQRYEKDLVEAREKLRENIDARIQKAEDRLAMLIAGKIHGLSSEEIAADLAILSFLREERKRVRSGGL